MKTRTYYPPDALRRLQEIDEYGELTGSSAPVPKPDPRGKNFRNLQKRRQEIEDYDEIMSGQFSLPRSPKKKEQDE